MDVSVSRPYGNCKLDKVMEKINKKQIEEIFDADKMAFIEKWELSQKVEALELEKKAAQKKASLTSGEVYELKISL